MGIVVHMEPLEHIGRKPYREVVLMDARYISIENLTKTNCFVSISPL